MNVAADRTAVFGEINTTTTSGTTATTLDRRELLIGVVGAEVHLAAEPSWNAGSASPT